MKLPSDKYVEYELDENSCWNVVNRNVQEDGTISCKVNYNGKKYSSLIRLSYDLFYEKITPNDVTIKRSCNNKRCINPNHLFEKRVGDWRIRELGKKYGKLEVIEYNGSYSDINRMVTCRCECGNVKNISINAIRMSSKKCIVSCGCVRTEKIANLNKTHSKSKTRLYKILSGAKHRCYGVNNPKYKNYGARGIKVCDEWLNNFMDFYNWAYKNGYEENLTLDRIDVNGNYEPSNCRWIKLGKQASNKQNTIWVEYHGEKLCLHELMSKLKRLNNYEAVKNYIIRDGFTLEEALGINSKFERNVLKVKYNLINNNISNCKISIDELSKISNRSKEILLKRYVNNDVFRNIIKELNIEVTE